MRKNVILFLLLVNLVFGGVVYAQSVQYADQDEFADWYSDAVMDLRDSGIMSGYRDNTFRPNQNVTRAEIAVILDKSKDYFFNSYDYFSIKRKYDELIDLGVDSFLAQDLAIAASGFNLSEEEPGLLDCTVVSNLPISSSYTVYNCLGYVRTIIHIKNENFHRPFGAVNNSIDKWYESPVGGGGKDFFIPRLFIEE